MGGGMKWEKLADNLPEMTFAYFMTFQDTRRTALQYNHFNILSLFLLLASPIDEQLPEGSLADPAS